MLPPVEWRRSHYRAFRRMLKRSPEGNLPGTSNRLANFRGNIGQEAGTLAIIE